MTIHLPPEVETSLLAKVHSGMFPSLDAAMTKAANLLLDQIEQTPPAKAKQKVKRTKSSQLVKKAALSVADIQQQMLASGFITQLPDPTQDIDDDDEPPIVIKGEPLSETIIRERR